MDGSHHDAPQQTDGHAFDLLARSLQLQLPRRRVAGLLAAAVATGVFGLSSHRQPTQAHKKRGKRRAQKAGGVETRRGSSIPPNCIYVCCDGTCDSWKMCLKCVKWPNPTTSGTLAP